MNIAKRAVPALFRGLLPVNIANSRLVKRYKKTRNHSTRKISSTSVAQSRQISEPIKNLATQRSRSLIRWLIFGTLTAGATFCVWEIAVPDYRSLINQHHYYMDWKIRFYTSLPWNYISSFIGTLSSIYIPYSLREPVLGWYAWTYGCNMEDAKNESLTAYPTFAAFFNRELKPKIRPISQSLLISPADGTVLHFGKVLNRRIEYVKGHDYDIEEFLGEHFADIKPKKGNSLFELVMYLAPGDYHSFHSPTSWQVTEKVHFPGHMLSVRPSILKLVPKLFCINERVVLNGNWRYGFFSMSAVAATNVGDIVILNEPTTDRTVKHTKNYDLVNEYMSFKAGDKVGEFRMGSAIALIFEAPSDIDFCIRAGDHLRYGQSVLIQAA